MTFLSLSRPIPLNLFKTFCDPHICMFYRNILLISYLFTFLLRVEASFDPTLFFFLEKKRTYYTEVLALCFLLFKFLIYNSVEFCSRNN